MDYLNPVIAQASDLPHSNEITIGKRRIGKSMVMFTLYGDNVDDFMSKFEEYRAIDQAFSANEVVMMIFKNIFKPSAKPQFDFDIHYHDEID